MKEKYRGLKMEHFVSKLNESHVRGMIGFHAFTGCDQIGKYNGTSKARLVRMYLSSTTDQVICFEMLGTRLIYSVMTWILRMMAYQSF